MTIRGVWDNILGEIISSGGSVNVPDEKRESQFAEEKLTARMARIIKRDWKTIPNCMSYFRIVLIPVFVILYVNGWYRSAAVVIVISWFSDVADGFVARKFNMISQLGKVLDPVADKLTQVAIFVCLGLRYHLAFVLVAVIAAKELTMLVLGMVVFKEGDRVDSAKWYGKLATGAIALTAIVLVAAPFFIEGGIPVETAKWPILGCIVLASFSYLMYVIRYVGIIKELKGR